MDWLSGVSLVDGPVFVLSYVLASVLAVALLIPAPAVRIRRGRFVLLVLGAAAGGGLIGAGLTFLLDDVLDVFGVALTPVVRVADALAFVAYGIAVVNLFTTRARRVIVAVVSILLTSWCLFLTINVDFGQYRSVGALTGTEYSGALELPERRAAPVPLADWRPPADLPTEGAAGAVSIPAASADFAPRSAVVYLPPAALVDDPPALPVVIAMSGQPGTPADVFSSAGVPAIVDRIARENDGLGPIVVVPDQLGDPSTNPMCVDSSRGDAATYLTVDVPAWIEAELNVETDRRAWTIAGFSQGGTCSIQLGAEHPEIFGSIVDISGERVPSLGSPQKTLDEGFGGDERAYAAAQPQNILAEGTPYRDAVAVFVVGESDRRYADYMRAVSSAATEAGMAVTIEIAPDSAHDWNTARFGFDVAFRSLLDRWGVAR